MAIGERRTCYVVGVSGGTACGKSTISRQLADALTGLRVELIPMDRYFKSTKPKVTAPITRVAYDDYNQPASFDLAALTHYLDDLRERTDGDAPEVVILEGLMTLQDDAVRERLDLKLYVDAPADERIVRRLKRNMAKGLDFDAIAAYYLDSVRYRHEEFVEPSRWHADLVLNGSHPSALSIRVLADWIRARVSGFPS